MKPVLTIRADATPTMGTGHVMRCLALAQAANNAGIEVRLIGRILVPWVLRRLEAESIAFDLLPDDVPKTEHPDLLLSQVGPASGWLVLDGYHFGSDCHKAAMAAGWRLLVIDDYAHLAEYHCDLLLNQNIGSENLSYQASSGKIMLGPGYSLLRTEFARARVQAEQRGPVQAVKNILLTLGGGDFSQHLYEIVSAMQQCELKDLTLRIVAGQMPVERLHSIFAKTDLNVKVVSNVQHMTDLMLTSDICITAGGSTCWELCCLGLPFMTVELAENQRGIISTLEERGFAHRFSQTEFLELSGDKEARAVCRKCIMALTKGEGASLVIQEMFDLPFIMRPALPADSAEVLALANDPVVRSVSFSQAPIQEHEHAKWYEARLQHKNEPFYVAYDQERLVGSIRFDFDDEGGFYVVAVAVSSGLRGQGLGKKLIRQGVAMLLAEHPSSKIYAWVRHDNPASLRAFSSAGFHELKAEVKYAVLSHCLLFDPSNGV